MQSEIARFITYKRSIRPILTINRTINIKAK